MTAGITKEPETARDRNGAVPVYPRVGRTVRESRPCPPAKRRRRPSRRPVPPWALPPQEVALVWPGPRPPSRSCGRSLAPQVETCAHTVSTDDAYVNGHVTLVAPRVSGQVKCVLVDEQRPRQEGVTCSSSSTRSRSRSGGFEALGRTVGSGRQTVAAACFQGPRPGGPARQPAAWKLRTASEQVDSQVAQASTRGRRAPDPGGPPSRRPGRLRPLGPGDGRSLALSREDFDQRQQHDAGAQAAVNQAREAVHQARVSLVSPPSRNRAGA